jgi:hypothetical protein
LQTLTLLIAAVANEEHATLLLKELKADYELVKVRPFTPDVLLLRMFARLSRICCCS